MNFSSVIKSLPIFHSINEIIHFSLSFLINHYTLPERSSMSLKVKRGNTVETKNFPFYKIPRRTRRRYSDDVMVINPSRKDKFKSNLFLFLRFPSSSLKIYIRQHSICFLLFGEIAMELSITYSVN